MTSPDALRAVASHNRMLATFIEMAAPLLDEDTRLWARVHRLTALACEAAANTPVRAVPEMTPRQRIVVDLVRRLTNAGGIVTVTNGRARIVAGGGTLPITLVRAVLDVVEDIEAMTVDGSLGRFLYGGSE